MRGHADIQRKSRARILLTGYAVTDNYCGCLGVRCVSNAPTKTSSANLCHCPLPSYSVVVAQPTPSRSTPILVAYFELYDLPLDVIDANRPPFGHRAAF